MIKIRSAAFCGLLLFSGAIAYADKLPALVNVPDVLDATQRARLIKQKEGLETELKAFQAAGKEFNAKSAQSQTDQEYNALQAQRTRYVAAAVAFNQQVDSAVVDARNVPSGLPKAVDDAIAGAFSDAPPGVSDRVRKGFQAVMSRDWPVAKAWFEDALNHDPGNLGLKRLAALTDYSKERSPKAHTAAPNAGDNETKKDLDQKLDGAFDEQLKSDLDDFYHNYLPKHPELVDPQRSSAPAQTSGDSKSGNDKSFSLPPPAEQKANWRALFDACFKTVPRNKRSSTVSGVRD